MIQSRLAAIVMPRLHRIALGLTSLLVFAWFYPEILFSSIFYNDATSHGAIIREMGRVWSAGGNITDFWMAYINFGHALLRSYQFLFHFIVWAAQKTILAGMPLEKAFNVCVTAMAMALPWAVYKGARVFGLERFEATVAAVVTVLIHEKGGYGLGLTNYTYSGYGLYNQLLATLFMPLTVGYAHRWLRAGKNVVATSMLFSATFMSHILTGYMACLWIAVDALVIFISERQGESARQWLRRLGISLAKFAGLVLLWTGHWLIPMIQDSLLQHKSEFEMAEKWTGFGAERVLTELITGLILDADRFPILTVVSGLGFVLCFFGWHPRFRSPLKRKLSLLTIAWIALSFGPMTWGSLLTVLPFSKTLHWHRFIAGAQLSLMFCAGMGIASFWRWLNPRVWMNLCAGIALFGVAAFLCVQERQTYFFKTNAYWLRNNQDEWAADSRHYKAILDFAKTHNDARYFAGDPLTNQWGNTLKVSQTVLLYGLLTQYNIENVGGIYHHQSHTEVLAFRMNWRNPDHLSLQNIGYLALPTSQKPLEGWTPLVQTGLATLYDTGLPKSYFTVGYPAGASCADDEILSRGITYYLQSPLLKLHVFPTIDLASHCEGRASLDSALIAEERKPAPPQALPGKILASKKEAGPQSDIHTAVVKMNSPGLVVFKMNYHPRWIAIMDGKQVPTEMVVPGFTGLRLEAGTHDIRLEYRPAPLKRALGWIALATYLFATVGVLVFAVRKRFILKLSH